MDDGGAGSLRGEPSPPFFHRRQGPGPGGRGERGDRVGEHGLGLVVPTLGRPPPIPHPPKGPGGRGRGGRPLRA